MDSASQNQPVGSARAGQQLWVHARLQGRGVLVDAAARIRSTYAVIWQTLTDYDHLSSFIPGITESTVIERRGCAAIVRQRGYAAFMFLSVPLDVVVESLEQAPSTIGIRVLQGNLKRLDGGYHLHQLPGERDDEYILGWSGLIEPAIPIPMAFAVPFLRAHIEDQFVGMVREIARRQAASEVRERSGTGTIAETGVGHRRALTAAA